MRQGLRENWRQFTLLVVINAFVGGMVGLERSLLPQLAQEEFGIASATAILSFIMTFGLAKAMANYAAGALANRAGRKSVLMWGWWLALPVPFLLFLAPSWGWVVMANVLLGLSQGLTWSSTVVMKIDLVGEKQRGLAMGLNEFAGYLAVGLVAFASAALASRYGLREVPFGMGVVFSTSGLLLSIWLVKDTRWHLATETASPTQVKVNSIFWATTWKNPTLNAITQAGFVNNLNDGMIWGILPLMLTALAFGQFEIGLVTGVYPVVWGIGQLFTGAWGDRVPKKRLLVWGMLLQGFMILMLPFARELYVLMLISGLLGLGTALVYPNFLAAVAEQVHPGQRAESMGVFRLWRDLGYVFGAILSGWVADRFGIPTAIFVVGGLTMGSGLVVKVRYGCRG